MYGSTVSDILVLFRFTSESGVEAQWAYLQANCTLTAQTASINSTILANFRTAVTSLLSQSDSNPYPTVYILRISHCSYFQDIYGNMFNEDAQMSVTIAALL